MKMIFQDLWVGFAVKNRFYVQPSGNWFWFSYIFLFHDCFYYSQTQYQKIKKSINFHQLFRISVALPNQSNSKLSNQTNFKGIWLYPYMTVNNLGLIWDLAFISYIHSLKCMLWRSSQPFKSIYCKNIVSGRGYYYFDEFLLRHPWKWAISMIF